jgi:hypothetical protein
MSFALAVHPESGGALRGHHDPQRARRFLPDHVGAPPFSGPERPTPAAAHRAAPLPTAGALTARVPVSDQGRSSWLPAVTLW